MWGGCGGRGVPKGARGPVSVCPVCPSPSVSSHRPCPSHLSVCPALCPPILCTDSVLFHPSFGVPAASCLSIHPSVCPHPSLCPSVLCHPPLSPLVSVPSCPQLLLCYHLRPSIPVRLSCLSIHPNVHLCTPLHPSVHPSLSVHPSHIQPSPSVRLSSRWPSVSPLPAGFPVGRGPLRGSAPAVGIPRLLHSGPWPHLSASAAAAEPSVCLSVPCMDPSVRSSSNKALSPKPSAFASGRWR